VAPNKFLAKIASAWKKPDGLTVIAPERVEVFLQKLPVDALWGVGPVTAARLRERGIERLVDVRTVEPAVLRDAVGSSADWLRQLADGIDDRAVEPNRETKSSGSENTYSQDLTEINEIRQEIDEMARDAAAWLEKTQPSAGLSRSRCAIRLHDHHAQPLKTPPTRDGKTSRSAPSGCSIARKPRPAPVRLPRRQRSTSRIPRLHSNLRSPAPF
jgi:nucleotidyltransferase/DNA polymerase involved in DNA repair